MSDRGPLTTRPASEAGSAPQGIRCRLNRHDYARQEVVRHPMRFGASFTNRICLRCGKQVWRND